MDGRTRRLPLACIPPPSPSPSSPPPPPRHGLRGGLRSCACALELERSGVAAAPGTPRSPAISFSALPWRWRWQAPARRGDGRAGQIRRPQARPVAAAAGSGGLDVRLQRWPRPPRAPSRASCAVEQRPFWCALHLPFRADGHGGCPREDVAGSRSPASSAAERRRQVLQARRRSRSQGRPEARIEGLRVDFPVVEGFFCKTSRICTIWTVCVLDRTAGENG